MWAVLIATLPSRPNAVRLRLWRAVKALGCGALRDGAFVLPDAHAGALDALAAEVLEHGGNAQVLSLAARTDAQQRDLLALFDRACAYAEWRASSQALAQALPALAEPEARRSLRSVAAALATVQAIDYVAGPASAQAQQEMESLRAAVEERFSPGEPRAGAARAPGRLDARRFQGRQWATRARPGVDRLASAWLIRRFIDRSAQFAFFEADARPPRGSVGFDYDGARFTHAGVQVTFEVLVDSFGLDGDPALQRIGRLVRFLDAGGIPLAQAAGLEMVLAGLRAQHADDHRLQRAAATVFDALYAAPPATDR